jgi:hypothetical protein
MLSDSTVARCIAEAERRVDAIEVLCEIITGQVKGERRELQELRSAIAAGQSPGATPSDIFVEALGGSSGR